MICNIGATPILFEASIILEICMSRKLNCLSKVCDCESYLLPLSDCRAELRSRSVLLGGSYTSQMHTLKQEKETHLKSTYTPIGNILNLDF